MNRASRVVVALTFGVALLLCAASAALADSYPAKPIRFIVPYQAGFAADTQARVLAQKLAESWGQQVVVDNRAGAGGIIGTEAAAKAAPDGYTIFLGGNAVFAINPALYRKVPYDAVKDFDPVSLASTVSLTLVVNPSVPAKSVSELIAFLKSKAGQVNFASTGTGTTVHLAGELFKTTAGVDMVHVPYKGGTVLTDLVDGRVSLMFATTSSVQSLVKAGKLRALATTGARRSPAMPDLPTVAEAGLPGFAVEAWFGVYVPAGTPKEITAKLNTEIVKILNMPDVRDRLSGAGLEAVTSTPGDLAAYLRAEIPKWAKVVKDSGARAD